MPKLMRCKLFQQTKSWNTDRILSSGSVKKQTDALGNVTSFKYDAYGNVTEKTNPDKTINITEYDGLQREKSTYFKWKAEAANQILTSTEYEFVKNYGFNVYTALDSKSSKSCGGLKTKKKKKNHSRKTGFDGNTCRFQRKSCY